MLRIFNIHYHTEFQDHTLNGVSLAPTSHVRMAAMFLLLLVGNYKFKYRLVSSGMVFVPSFMKIRYWFDSC
jgi:hypothetical protein